MDDDIVGEITKLLQAAKAGQHGAMDRLFSRVYDELRKIAKNRINAGNYWASEPTTLVNEAYIRLVKTDNPSWEDRHHFFWGAARAMRDVLVDRARSEDTIKRGGRQKRVELQEDMAAASEPPDLLDLNEALSMLEAVHPIPAKVVMFKFFAGLSREEIAELMNVSPATVYREWDFARAWLRNHLGNKDHISKYPN